MEASRAVTIKLTEDQAKFVKAAAREWTAMKKGREWNGWMKIGAALMIGRNVVLADLGQGRNYINTKPYRKAFAEWMQVNGFRNPPIEPSTVSHLLYLNEPEHRLICDELLARMSQKERERINHPTPMYRRVKAEMDRHDGIDPHKDKLRRKAAERSETEAKLADYEERLAAMDPEIQAMHWFTRAAAATIAQRLCEADQARARAIAQAILAQLDEIGEFEGRLPRKLRPL